MSIIIKGITKEEFARRMWGEGVEKVNPDIIGSCNSYYGFEVEQLPPHGRLIDADALNYSRVRIYHEDGTVGGYNAVVLSAEIKDAPTIIEAEGGRE